MQVSVEVSKEAYELGQGLAKFVGALKQASADGWQLGQDLPVVLSSAMLDLVPALQGVDQLPEEAKDVAMFGKTMALVAADIAAAVMKKD